MGMPMSLLWLAGVLAVRKVDSSTVEIISLVVDLPTEPVTPTTFMPMRLRSPLAILPRAMRVSGTTMAGQSPSQRSHSTAAAPFSRAMGMKSWPSLAPFRAMKS